MPSVERSSHDAQVKFQLKLVKQNLYLYIQKRNHCYYSERKEIDPLWGSHKGLLKVSPATLQV